MCVCVCFFTLYMYDIYIIYIYIYTVHILYIYILYIYCTYTVHILYIYCTYTVHILYIYCTYIHKYQGSLPRFFNPFGNAEFKTKASQILTVLIYRIQIPRCTNGHEDWMVHNCCMLIDDISLWFNGSICRTCVFQGSITIINNLHLCFHGFIPPCVVGYENSPVSSVFYVQIYVQIHIFWYVYIIFGLKSWFATIFAAFPGATDLFFSLRLCLAQLPGWDRNIVVKSVELEKPRRIHNHSAAENDPLPFHSYHLVLVGVSTRIAHHSYAILISFEAGSSQFCHWAHDNIFSSFAYVPMDILFPTGWKE